jgi:phosphoadenosine phosphosulfate reductase
MGLEAKIRKARKVIRTALRKWECGVAFSGGKDSTALLHLVRQQAPEKPLLFADTSVKFPETYQFMEDLRERWDLNLHTARNEWDAGQWEQDKVACCYRLKVEPFNQLVTSLGLEAVFVAIRRDEHPARAKAQYYDNIGGVTHIEKVEYDHMRVHPILDWTEEDVWAYIRENDLPYNPLYDQGYRSIGCQPCTAPSAETERSGREQDKELVLNRLRKLGYF